MALYPTNINISKQLCVIVGGGPVAYRKIKSLLYCDATVRIISPEVIPEIEQLALNGKVEWIARKYVEGDVKDALLIFAATDNRSVQEVIAKEAKKYSVLINSADDPVNSCFHVPAHLRRGKLLVTVSTEGGSPAFAKRIREDLERKFGHEYGEVIDLLLVIRNAVVGKDPVGESSATHKVLFDRLFAMDIVGLVLQKNWFDLQMMLLRELPGEIDATEVIKQFMARYDREKRPLDTSK